MCAHRAASLGRAADRVICCSSLHCCRPAQASQLGLRLLGMRGDAHSRRSGLLPPLYFYYFFNSGKKTYSMRSILNQLFHMQHGVVCCLLEDLSCHHRDWNPEPTGQPRPSQGHAPSPAQTMPGLLCFCELDCSFAAMNNAIMNVGVQMFL